MYVIKLLVLFVHSN